MEKHLRLIRGVKVLVEPDAEADDFVVSADGRLTWESDGESLAVEDGAGGGYLEGE